MSLDTDPVWKEYGEVFRSLDDFTLARWMAQTLGQIRGRVMRVSHPLVVTYRLAADLARERNIWQMRLVDAPHGYYLSPCCSAPFLPRFHRDVIETGLLCEHCWETLVPLDCLPNSLETRSVEWCRLYHRVHAVAHWDSAKQQALDNYEKKRKEAVGRAISLMLKLKAQLLPRFVEHYPAILWDDQDECLGIEPDDIA